MSRLAVDQQLAEPLATIIVMRSPFPPRPPHLPVAPLSLQGGALVPRPVPEFDMNDVDDRTVAALVRLRLQLEQQHGWLVLGLLGAAVASVVAVGASVESRLALGAYAAAVAAGAVASGFVADQVGYALFRHRALGAGLSDEASRQLFRRATDAGHWLDVLRTCGHVPADGEVAAFVRCR
jgi:hypothetical protein